MPNYSADFQIDTTPGGASPTWASMCDGFDNVAPAINETVQEYFSLCAKGYGSSDVVALHLKFTLSGVRKVGDAAEVPLHRADDNAEHEPRAGKQQSEEKRDAKSVDNPRIDIPSAGVDAERMPGAGAERKRHRLRRQLGLHRPRRLRRLEEHPRVAVARRRAHMVAAKRLGKRVRPGKVRADGAADLFRTLEVVHLAVRRRAEARLARIVDAHLRRRAVGLERLRVHHRPRIARTGDLRRQAEDEHRREREERPPRPPVAAERGEPPLRQWGDERHFRYLLAKSILGSMSIYRQSEIRLPASWNTEVSASKARNTA